MGVERSVTRWYILRNALLYEITVLEAQLATSQVLSETVTTEDRVEEQPLAASQEPSETIPSEDKADLQRQLAKVQERLRTLGPCPKPMMG